MTFMYNTVIAGVNLNNLKANHNRYDQSCGKTCTVIAGVNLNNLKANHNGKNSLISGFKLLSLA